MRRRRHLLLALAAAYLIGLHAALGVLVVKTDFIERVERKLAPSHLNQEFNGTYRRWSAELARSDARAWPDALLFVGDSIIRALDTSSMARHTLNMGIPGDTTAGVLDRLETYRTLTTARGVVLGVGVNDLRWRSVGEALDNYRQVLDLIPATTPTLVTAVLPLDERVQNRLSNAPILAMNEGLAVLCAERPNCRFVDPTADLIDGTGNLSAWAHDGDGLHLSLAGHDIYWHAVYAAVVAMMPPAAEIPLRR